MGVRIDSSWNDQLACRIDHLRSFFWLDVVGNFDDETSLAENISLELTIGIDDGSSLDQKLEMREEMVTGEDMPKNVGRGV